MGRHVIVYPLRAYPSRFSLTRGFTRDLPEVYPKLAATLRRLCDDGGQTESVRL